MSVTKTKDGAEKPSWLAGTTPYMPILKWKGGEAKALTNIAADVKPLIFPLLEIVPDSDREDPDEPSRPYPDIVKSIATAWGTQPVAIDVGLLDATALASQGSKHLLEYMFNFARLHGLQAVPVTGIDSDPAHDAAVGRIVAQDQRGAVIRVTGEALLEDTLLDDLRAVLQRVGAVPEMVDLLLDWGYVDPAQHRSIAMAASGVLGLVADAPWRSTTFASGCFPQVLTQVGTTTLPRADWSMWCRIHGQKAHRRVRFGDYAIAHPVYALTPYSGAANIRYTLETEWLICRGHKVTGAAYGGHAQFITLAAGLVADPRYCGASFSWGDGYIAQCAAGTVTSGNLTTWRAVGTNHHLAFVGRQIAKIP